MKKQLGIATAFVVVAIGAFVFTSRTSADEMLYSQKEMVVEYNTEEKIKQDVKQALTEDGKVFLQFTEETKVDANEYKFIAEVKQSDNEMAYADEIVEVLVDVEDSHAPVIEANTELVELTEGDAFSIESLEIKAYDVIDGELAYNITENTVDTSVVGEQKIVIEAVDVNGNTSRKIIQVHVKEEEVVQPVQQSNVQSANEVPVQNLASAQPALPALDRNNLTVRGWTIVAGANVSDDVIRAYMSELNNLPGKYNASALHTITIDTSMPYPYLGMAYSDGRMWLNGASYYATTALHEATHAYDFAARASLNGEFQGIFQRERGRLPIKFSSNMNDNAYEWLANAVVFYYYDQGTLAASAPETYAYVANNVLR